MKYVLLFEWSVKMLPVEAKDVIGAVFSELKSWLGSERVAVMQLRHELHVGPVEVREGGFAGTLRVSVRGPPELAALIAAIVEATGVVATSPAKFALAQAEPAWARAVERAKELYQALPRHGDYVDLEFALSVLRFARRYAREAPEVAAGFVGLAAEVLRAAGREGDARVAEKVAAALKLGGEALADLTKALDSSRPVEGSLRALIDKALGARGRELQAGELAGYVGSAAGLLKGGKLAEALAVLRRARERCAPKHAEFVEKLEAALRSPSARALADAEEAAARLEEPVRKAANSLLKALARAARRVVESTEDAVRLLEERFRPGEVEELLLRGEEFAEKGGVAVRVLGPDGELTEAAKEYVERHGLSAALLTSEGRRRLHAAVKGLRQAATSLARGGTELALKALSSALGGAGEGREAGVLKRAYGLLEKFASAELEEGDISKFEAELPEGALGREARFFANALRVALVRRQMQVAGGGGA